MVAAVNNNTGGGRIANGISTERKVVDFTVTFTTTRTRHYFGWGGALRKLPSASATMRLWRRDNIILPCQPPTGAKSLVARCCCSGWRKWNKSKTVSCRRLDPLSPSAAWIGFTMFEKWRNSVAVTSNGNNAPIIYTKKHEATQWLIWQPAS